MNLIRSNQVKQKAIETLEEAIMSCYGSQKVVEQEPYSDPIELCLRIEFNWPNQSVSNNADNRIVEQKRNIVCNRSINLNNISISKEEPKHIKMFQPYSYETNGSEQQCSRETNMEDVAKSFQSKQQRIVIKTNNHESYYGTIQDINSNLLVFETISKCINYISMNTIISIGEY